MSSIDRLFLMVAIIADIFLIYFISERSIVFILAIIELVVCIGVICLIGWIVERLMNPHQKKPEITIERLDLDYQYLETLNQWCTKHDLNLTIPEKLEIIRSYKDKRLSIGSLKMAFIVNVAIVALTVTTLILYERDTIIHNLLDSAASNSTLSQLAEYQVKTMTSDIGIVIAIALLFLVAMFFNIYILWEAVNEN
jgi:hypothetical protein